MSEGEKQDGKPAEREPGNNNVWILVAGTGRPWGVPNDVSLAAAAVGEKIARFGCGLVTGGWPGVDHIAAKAFAEVELGLGHRLDDRLVQVVATAHRTADFNYGRIVSTNVGPLEWLEPQSYCDAIVLIGGLGGTYGAFLSALYKGIPRFPLGGTGGDAAIAFRSMCELWDIIPNSGIHKEQFETLGTTPSTPEEAAELAGRLLPLVIKSVKHRRGQKKSVFLSYSRRDADWLQQVKEALAPVADSRRVEIWSDLNLEPGAQWDAELRRTMSVSDVAILLVSANYLESEYVQRVELPVLLERAKTGQTRLLWLPLTPSSWKETGLHDTQAASDPNTPLSEMDPAGRKVALVQFCQKVEAYTLHTTTPTNEGGAAT